MWWQKTSKKHVVHTTYHQHYAATESYILNYFYYIIGEFFDIFFVIVFVRTKLFQVGRNSVTGCTWKYQAHEH